MSTDEEIVEEDNELLSAFAEASVAIYLKATERTRTFAEVVDDYRGLEAEFVARAGDDERSALEVRRRIAEHVLSAARDKAPRFEVCRGAWNELIRLGFTNIWIRCLTTWSYLDCCAYDEQPEEGLAVVEPLLAELERGLEEARAAQRPTDFYEEELERYGDLRDELLAQQRGQLSPSRRTRRMDEASQPAPEKEKIDEIDDELRKACRAVFKSFARSQDRSFAEVAADYKRIEADTVARAGEGQAFQAFVLNVRQRIAEDILQAACWLKQPFEVCREAWNDLVRVGFTSISERCWKTTYYAESCGENQKPEEGLAVLEPFLAELQRGLEAGLARRSEARAKLEPPRHGPSPRFYRQWIKSLGELRDKLEAARKGAEPST
ncbi:hypothetical protein [Polyangium jinanense]|uniref:Uncharacterized protein n=1 Tax=Polyangium jinanense TaxID=2829994 RepID=A0A9X3XDI9_9BACT|nr:hypothetical protein [Polyangium jinanense]MDC3958378.1 hypothetical protein [Polyangium jinanense]MDC3988292.1 hypothetical protein [Polyangium jinanense]